MRLCQALNWARTTLDRRLETDAAFPVVMRGGKGGGWQFDITEVKAYLDGVPTTGATRESGPVSTLTAGEQTARQRRDAVQAEILEDQLRRNRGELVQVEVMRQVLNTMLAHLGQGLDRLSDQVVERLNLPEESSTDIREITDELRRVMSDELRTLLNDPKR